MAVTQIILLGTVLLELAEGAARMIELARKMQAGQEITEADLAAARQRTDAAMDRLEKANAKRQEQETDGN